MIKVDRDLLGESLHTCMRKGMDSNWASLMYVAVQLVDYDYWLWFLEILHHNLEKRGYTEETFKFVFEEFGSMAVWDMMEKTGREREYRDWMDKHREDADHRRHITVFECAVNMAEDLDYKCFCSWMEHYHTVEEEDVA